MQMVADRSGVLLVTSNDCMKYFHCSGATRGLSQWGNFAGGGQLATSQHSKK